MIIAAMRNKRGFDDDDNNDDDDDAVETRKCIHWSNEMKKCQRKRMQRMQKLFHLTLYIREFNWSKCEVYIIGCHKLPF